MQKYIVCKKKKNSTSNKDKGLVGEREREREREMWLNNTKGQFVVKWLVPLLCTWP